MSAKASVENLVIGGGLAGAMTALRLAAAGREVLLAEKEPGAHAKVCGEFLSPEAVDYLGQAGIDPLLLGAVPIRRLRLVVGAKVVETRLPFRALSLSRRVLDEALLARARQEGCAVRRGASVDRLAGGDSGWTAELRDETRLEARTVFLATGKHDLRGWSRPAGKQSDLLGFKMHWRLRHTETAALRGWMDLFLFDGGYGGLSPVEGGAANLCLVVRRARLRRLGGWRELLAELRGESAHIARRLDEAEPLWDRPLAVSSIPYGYMARQSGGPWRIGDQAAVIPSFTGDGMAIALHSGLLAAQMHLAGKDRHEYLRELGSHLQRSMSMATLLSRAMVSDAGRVAAPFVLGALPGALSWVAAATRIPAPALLRASLRQTA